MTEAISVFSFKGGSGKTLVSMNLAAYLASQGKKVAIIDMDLSAPSLQTYAPNRTEKKINDYLLDNVDISEVLFDASYLLEEGISGKLYMALADPSGEGISKINQRNQDDLLNDLFQLMTLVRNTLPEAPWELDYVIIDSSPGLTTHAINGVAITNHVLMILRLVNADLDGTFQFLETLYKSVQPRISLIVNQMAKHLLSEEGKAMINDLVNKNIVEKLPNGNIRLGGIIPNDDSVIGNEFSYIMNKQHTNVVEPRPIHLIKENTKEFAYLFGGIVNNLLGEE